MQKNIISLQPENDMKVLIEAVTTIRNIRSVWNIDPRTPVNAIINTPDKTFEKLLMDNAELVKRLGRVAELKAGKFAKPKGAAVSVIGKSEVYIPLEGVIDFEKEKTRLAKDEARIKNDIANFKKRLSDKNFTSKAPEDVVASQRERLSELEVQAKKLRENLKELG
jgi:valyl-tRNA synthetase